MSIDVTITQKGLFKKKLPLQVILGDTLQFGCYEDRDTLVPQKLTDKGFVAYDPGGIARGISVYWNPNRTGKVELRLLNPTSRREIGQFYDMIDRIGRVWNCEVLQEDRPIPLPVPQTVRERAIQVNESSGRAFVDKLLSEGGAFTLQSALFPITIGPPEAQELHAAGEDAYAPLLHRLQSMDVWYAQPTLYNTPQGGVMGVYVLSENVRSVFPQKPGLPMRLQLMPKDQRPTVTDWRVGLYLEGWTEKTPPPFLSYDQMLERLPPHKISRFDAATVLIKNLTHAEMLALAEGAAPDGG